MTLRKGKSSVTISDDPNEVNPVCLIFARAGILEQCPAWMVCKCAVCTKAQNELNTICSDDEPP